MAAHLPTQPLSDPIISVYRHGSCGAVWRLETGDLGAGRAAWCPSRAARRGQRAPARRVGLDEITRAVGRARRRPDWLWFAPREDAFAASADPARREELLVAMRRLLAEGIDLAVVTRGGLRDSDGLVRLARAAGKCLTVRVGVFSSDQRVVRVWEQGLAPTRERLALAAALRRAGTAVAIELGPIVPFVNDSIGGLEETLRLTARAGLVQVVPRWVTDARGLRGQVEAEVSPSRARILAGAFSGAARDRRDGTVISFEARRVRRRRIHQAAQKLGMTVDECRCVQTGDAAVTCWRPPGGRSPRRQLDLFGKGA